MNNPGSLADFMDRLRNENPAYLDLFVADTDAEFESAFNKLLAQAIENLETNSKNYMGLNEEGLSAVLAAGIRVPGVHVTQESNSNGHVDITIYVGLSKPLRKKLGEAKIYDGKAYHWQGVRQLLGYMTGRECRGLMLIYVRKKNISGIIRKLRNDMDEAKPEEQRGNTRDDDLRWSFVSSHEHDSGEHIEISHVGLNLYVP